MKIPKFHDKNSLYLGALAGLFIVVSGMFHTLQIVGIIQMLIGGGLALHCFDMIRYYKKHRVVRIDKTDTERIVHKVDAKKDKSLA